MESIFFSVIIPTYNQASLLEKAVKSVLNQSFKNFEIIIVDNYSDDETQKIVESFQSKKIIYKKIENHGVIARSRNLAIKLKSDYNFWKECSEEAVVNYETHFSEEVFIKDMKEKLSKC